MIDENKEYPKVSIITVVYNGVRTLEQTILSVVNQTYQNIEYIIIDGRSTDGTINLIKRFEDKISTWVSEGDNGLYDAMNKGISLATGEIIAILNSDDWYESDAIYEVVKAFKKSNAEIIVGKMNLVKFDKTFIKVIDNKNLEDNIHKLIMPLNHPSTFVKMSTYEKIGKFDCDYKIAADYDFIYRAYINHIKIEFCNSIFTNMRLGGKTGGMGGVKGLNNSFIAAKEAYLIVLQYTGKKEKLRYYLKIGYLYLRKIKRFFIKSKYDN